MKRKDKCNDKDWTADQEQLLKTLHAALLVYLKMLLLAPDIPQLRGTTTGLCYFGLFAVCAVFRSDRRKRNKAGHLTVFGHLDFALGAPDSPRRRPLPVRLQFMSVPACTTVSTHDTALSDTRNKRVYGRDRVTIRVFLIRSISKVTPAGSSSI